MGRVVGAKRGNRFVFGMLGVIFLGVAGLLVAGEVFRQYDRAHPVQVTCVVESASPATGGSTSGRGIGTTFDQVEISTEDCGPLVLRRGVDEANKERLAASFERGADHRFMVGAASYRWRSVLHFFRTPVIVSEAEPVSEEDQR
ncbi:hypothetical protein C1N91_14595 [Curtobacterium sp. SGAir0471]|nr:hypothetical protein C1N91_14595 [Curtobacterium sp. SGAir0471]